MWQVTFNFIDEEKEECNDDKNLSWGATRETGRVSCDLTRPIFLISYDLPLTV